uniref:CMP/dCMP-type deaminase domain-containing protein n=1 Tax=Timspurckia oligopyrenoides TaxID=708627 RepID=A0A7S0ZE26_9RHOD|mmetsp:Transcript_1689/g.2993  ORF Transcript_1689/g.2993 Transcript_1689/m.2993 type:complete len:179 (+) Transcript_1689:159-695(+)|eukprot:CAMPEP_0182448928 /NCGR_PEP_ID=MMETSP1172-20130603/30841_1 /TAXON_ID=708627 /ORGANISM="Timspurckia oligopyrenoides, Strain CCMP3278" /LENGTH=178 /DNA_ID=CAMNT_0024645985 /DNA_START=139 /DNA_END=675 /DNA_ORIENTATION=-
MGEIGSKDSLISTLKHQHPSAYYMEMALDLARQSALVEYSGGPFGCVIVDATSGEVIGKGRNQVMTTFDPTCHGEIDAIRNACKYRKSHILSGCILYTSAEPCPMCYSAIWWARIDMIYSACSVKDTEEFGGFDDSEIVHALKQDDISLRKLPGQFFMRDEMIDLWKQVKNDPKSPHY